MENTISRGKLYGSIFALGVAGGSIYILPYIKFVFYDLQLQVTGMTNTQSALLLTFYAIVGLFISVPAGILVDKIDVKKGLLIALLGTTLVTCVYAFMLTSYAVAAVIWMLQAFFQSGLYWLSFSKILNIIGAKTDKSGEGKSGISFGAYYAVNGITGAVINATALWASNQFADPIMSFRAAVLTAAAFTTIAMILVIILMDKELITYVPDESKADEVEKVKNEKSVKLLFDVAKNPMTWAAVIVCIVGYALYSLQGYFTPYLTAVQGISSSDSAIFAIIRTYVFFTLAPIGGVIADKVFHSTAKWIGVAFAIMVVIVGGFFLIPKGMSPMIVGFYTLLPSAFVQMTYTIKYSVLNEIKVSPALLATTTSIAATAASIVDLAFTPFIGWCLDTQGNNAYTILFIMLMVLLALGSAAGFAIAKNNKKAA